MTLLLKNNIFNRKHIRISLCLYIGIYKRNTGLMAAGTKLVGTARIPFGLIATYHNLWLRNLIAFDKNNIDIQMIRFIQQYYMINPKYMQHIFCIAYPKYPFSLLTLETYFPEIGIIDSKSTISAGFDVLLPLIVAATAMKKTSIFNEGKISVIGFPDETKHKKVFNSVEYQHTGQPHPDYHYQLNSKTNLWERYYDLKTGKIEVNKGHIFCVNDGQQYEEYSQKILNAQKTCYKDNALIYYKLKELINNKSLTWGQRNDLFQIYMKENMSQFTGLNPSFVIKTDYLYEIANAKPQQKVMTVLNNAGAGCIESQEKSVMTIAECIRTGGKICIENYFKTPHANNTIKELLSMTKESITFLSEKL